LVGTLGHVAEGKSTGVKTQRHQNEQERNIPFHLGYANCKVYRDDAGYITAQKTSDPASPNNTLIAYLSFVDCPDPKVFFEEIG
jgi:translation initiation factor 2 gamma subunit (eIF-2gamma)